MKMPEISRSRALAYACALLVLLVIAGRFLGADGEKAGAAKAQGVPAPAVKAEPAPVRRLLVHVAGAVRRPGLYELEEGSRVDDAIQRAGGAKPKGALELVNLAAPVADGQQVLVPLRGEAPIAAQGSGSGAAAVPGTRVHLNSATLEELDTLPGVGPVTAQKILDYRAEHGAFASVDELDAVPGIGPARLAELRELVDL
jgi:competence protein ComEA